MNVAAVRRALLGWYDRQRRDLPWRRTNDPYRVWVSEVMLQQTTVKAVLPYYEEFLKRFPSLQALAEEPEEEVVAAWSGLGYYHRARNLHRGAQAVAERHGGRFPRTLEAALAVPGVGLYTASAILSIAHGLPLPVVDGNAIVGQTTAVTAGSSKVLLLTDNSSAIDAIVQTSSEPR